jgi:hypothetical protein
MQYRTVFSLVFKVLTSCEVRNLALSAEGLVSVVPVLILVGDPLGELR